MMFKELVDKASKGKPVRLSRKVLFEVFPHRGRALVASAGRVHGETHSLTLWPSDFGPYTKGHGWFFPVHWLSEMAAQAAGLRAAVEIYRTLGEEGAAAFNRPSTVSLGNWEKKPLTTDICSVKLEPIVAVVTQFAIHSGGRIEYTAGVTLSQGERSAVWSGIRVLVTKGN